MSDPPSFLPGDGGTTWDRVTVPATKPVWVRVEGLRKLLKRNDVTD
jgi:hypothetical protein